WPPRGDRDRSAAQRQVADGPRTLHARTELARQVLPLSSVTAPPLGSPPGGVSESRTFHRVSQPFVRKIRRRTGPGLSFWRTSLMELPSGLPTNELAGRVTGASGVRAPSVAARSRPSAVGSDGGGAGGWARCRSRAAGRAAR